MIFVFKCVSLTRMQAYNLIALFQFIFWKATKSAPCCLLLRRKCKFCQYEWHNHAWEKSIPISSNQHRREKDTTYIVDCSLGICMYMQIPGEQGINGNVCLHQVAVALKYGISNLNFIPQTAKERFSIIAILAARNNTKFSVFQFVFSNWNWFPFLWKSRSNWRGTPSQDTHVYSTGYPPEAQDNHECGDPWCS